MFLKSVYNSLCMAHFLSKNVTRYAHKHFKLITVSYIAIMFISMTIDTNILFIMKSSLSFLLFLIFLNDVISGKIDFKRIKLVLVLPKLVNHI